MTETIGSTRQERNDFFRSLFDEIAGLQMAQQTAHDSLFAMATNFETICESFPILFADIETGEILYASKVVEEMFGYRVRGDLLHQCVDVLVPVELRAKHAEHRKAFFENPSNRQMGQRGVKLFGLHRDGHVFPVEITLNAAKVGNQRCVLALVADMSSRTEGFERGASGKTEAQTA